MTISQRLLGMIWKHAHRRRAGSAQIAKLSRMYTDAYENCDYNINSNGERRVIEQVAAIHPAEVFDIGANAGDFGGIFLACSAARVHFFELCDETFRRLSASISAGDRVRLNNIGLAAQEGEVEYRYYSASDGVTTLITSKEVHNALGELRQGRTTTVDKYASFHKVESIDYLRIDVEGAEHQVLRGSERRLREGRIKAIQFEYGMASIYARLLLKDFFMNSWSLLATKSGRSCPAVWNDGRTMRAMKNFLAQTFWLCFARKSASSMQFGELRQDESRTPTQTARACRLASPQGTRFEVPGLFNCL